MGFNGSSTTDGLTYVVADPDPDGTDSFQITVGFLEQVTHQLIKATFDRHLGNRKGVLHQGLEEGWGNPVPAICSQFCSSSRQGSWRRGTEGQRLVRG
jgi:hypothetical protein